MSIVGGGAVSLTVAPRRLLAVETPDRYIVVPGCHAASVGETTMVLLPSLQYLELDEVGAAIFDGVERGRRVPDLVADLLGVYEIDAETLEADVAGYLAILVDHGAIRPG